ncbi:MAG: hypothetical protein WAK89_19740 [Candidatus Sulfotelmatobacter sp.]
MSAYRLRNKVGIVTVLVVLLGTATAKVSESGRHFSTAEGRTVRMQPSGTTFEVPEGRWDGWYLDRAELDKAKGGKGEWYTEYARVANAALPFENCSVQTGTYLWNAPTFFGVTVRGYSLDSAAGEVEARIRSKALSAARHLPHKTAGNASVTESRQKQWSRLLIGYDVWYGDYGGRANVDFYVTEVEGKTIVLVFMYAGVNNNISVVKQILESFSSH